MLLGTAHLVGIEPLSPPVGHGAPRPLGRGLLGHPSLSQGIAVHHYPGSQGLGVLQQPLHGPPDLGVQLPHVGDQDIEHPEDVLRPLGLHPP